MIATTPRMIVRHALARLGYQLVKVGRVAPGTYASLIEELIGIKGRISVAVVGANDGMIADPMHGISRKLGSKMDMLLVEPQTRLLPYLERNYAHQLSKKIFNGAVGPEGSLRLYYVREEYWNDLRVPYARGWPSYRAPTGITSSDRDRVADWFSRFYTGTANADVAVAVLDVRSAALKDIVIEAGFGPKIDVLQVDAEGSDDAVLFNSDLEVLRPEIIRYECHQMVPERQVHLKSWLQGLGYALLNDGGDTIALRLGSAPRETMSTSGLS